MADPRIVKQLGTASRAVSKAAVWTASKPIGKEDHYLFEFLCYAQLVRAAKQQFKIKFRKINGQCRWPQKPGEKSNFSYIDLIKRETEELTWQVCTGTKIKDIDGSDRAPDISLQVPHASDSPTWADVRAIWDAKHRESESDRITRNEFGQFRHIMRQLKIRKPSVNDGLDDLGKDIYRVPALITNGQFSTEKDGTLLRIGFSEVRGFLKSPEIRPHNEEHLVRQAILKKIFVVLRSGYESLNKFITHRR